MSQEDNIFNGDPAAPNADSNSDSNGGANRRGGAKPGAETPRAKVNRVIRAFLEAIDARVLHPFMGDAPRNARLLAAAGIVPFLFLGLLSLLLSLLVDTWVDAWVDAWVDGALLSWAAIILAGLGMARFGFAAAEVGGALSSRLWMMAVAPSLYAWLALMFAPLNGLAMLLMAVGFVIMYFTDVRAANDGYAPFWWKQYRLPPTIAAVAGLLLGAL